MICLFELWILYCLTINLRVFFQGVCSVCFEISKYFKNIYLSVLRIILLGSFHVKSTNPSHLTHTDFVHVLWSQCTHQEMKILKILSSSHKRFQNYDRLNYGSSSLDNKPLQFMAFWNCSYSASFNSKHLKFWMGTHFLEVFTTKNLFSENFENYTCGGVLKLSNWPLQYFFSHFQWAITS